jgi:hypothetical protein
LAPEVEGPFKQVAGPVDEDTNRRVTDTTPMEAPPHELTLVYEINADEYPPAEDKLAQDYSEPTESSQPQASARPEGIDDTPLPYEGRPEEKGLAASGAASHDFADGSTKEKSSSPRCRPASADRVNPKSAANDSAPQPRLPGMD